MLIATYIFILSLFELDVDESMYTLALFEMVIEMVIMAIGGFFWLLATL